MVIIVSILAFHKQSIKTIVKIDSSNYIGSRVSFQLDDNKLLKPIRLFFKNFNPIKYNYIIYNKRLIAIIRCFK